MAVFERFELLVRLPVLLIIPLLFISLLLVMDALLLIVPELLKVLLFMTVPPSLFTMPKLVMVPWLLIVVLRLVNVAELAIINVSLASILKVVRVRPSPPMVHVPYFPAFHVPGNDLHSVPLRDGVKPGLPALADGISVKRSRSDKTPTKFFDLLDLNIFENLSVGLNSEFF